MSRPTAYHFTLSSDFEDNVDTHPEYLAQVLQRNIALPDDHAFKEVGSYEGRCVVHWTEDARVTRYLSVFFAGAPIKSRVVSFDELAARPDAFVGARVMVFNLRTYRDVEESIGHKTHTSTHSRLPVLAFIPLFQDVPEESKSGG